MEILALVLMHAISVDTGQLSYYFPGDGYNRGVLACGGEFVMEMDHIAHRAWRRMGCGRPVLVCAQQTLSCALTRVRDAGPFGIARRKSWRVHTGIRPPAGWHWRAAADLSYGLWQRLGRPRTLSRIHLVFLPRPTTRVLRWLEETIVHHYQRFTS